MSGTRDELRLDRRRMLAFAALGSFAPAAAAIASTTRTSSDTIAACSPFAGMEFTPAEREQMLTTVDSQLDRLRMLRAVDFENDLAPAELFDPRLPGWTIRPLPDGVARNAAPPALPQNVDDIAFAPAWHQTAWLARGKLRSRELVDIYLERIAARGPRLECFVAVLADAARAEAETLDRERSQGQVRGPLHGLPYGLKDLIDAAGTSTTWGAEPFRNRVAATDAAIVSRLRAAGAILLAKTSCGALAYGDIWFGGRTRNPWNIEEGSSGSSAGSAAAVADGLCSFAIGTETMGSIVAPSARCGTVGLRPTFGRVARTGAMALCWSLDKIGALGRSVDDVGLVLAAINGGDMGDPASIDMPLSRPPEIDPARVTLGYRQQWFDAGRPTDRAMLAAARKAGFRLVEVAMPKTSPKLLGAIVVTEAAAAFEQITLDDIDDQLAWQEEAAWPNSWRAARFEPAIGYIQAQRLRRRLMQEFAETMAGVDALLHPNDAGDLLAIGNHTGYPALVLPSGFLPQPTRKGFVGYVAPSDVPRGVAVRNVPFTTTLTGHLFDEPRLLAIGAVLERQMQLGRRRPPE